MLLWLKELKKSGVIIWKIKVCAIFNLQTTLVSKIALIFTKKMHFPGALYLMHRSVTIWVIKSHGMVCFLIFNLFKIVPVNYMNYRQISLVKETFCIPWCPTFYGHTPHEHFYNHDAAFPHSNILFKIMLFKKWILIQKEKA